MDVESSLFFGGWIVGSHSAHGPFHWNIHHGASLSSAPAGRPDSMLGFVLWGDPLTLLRFDILSSCAPNKQHLSRYAFCQASHLCCRRDIYYLGPRLEGFSCYSRPVWRPVRWSAKLCSTKKKIPQKMRKKHLKSYMAFCFDRFSMRVVLKS